MKDKEVAPSENDEGNKIGKNSPHCIKENVSLPEDKTDDMPHSSQETASACSSVQSDLVITESMLEAETNMEKETLQKEAEMNRQVQQDVFKLDGGQREVRYQQLKFLLNRSQAYAKYLSGRIERQKVELSRKKQVHRDGVTPSADTTLVGGADRHCCLGDEALAQGAQTERLSKENVTNGDSVTCETTCDGDSDDKSSLSEMSGDSPKSVPCDDKTLGVNNCDVQTKTSEQVSDDRENKSCKKVDNTVSKRMTRSTWNTYCSRLTAVNISTPEDTGSISCGRTRSRKKVSTDNSHDTPATAKTKATISCNTDFTASTRRTRNSGNICCDSPKELPQCQTSRREIISQDTSSGPELHQDTHGKQTDGTISCDSVRVTRSASKITTCDPAGRRAINKNIDKKTVRSVRKRKADVITDNLEEALVRIKREKVAEEETKCSTLTSSNDATVAMDTPVAMDMPVAMDTASVVATNSCHVATTSICDVSTTNATPPSGRDVLGTKTTPPSDRDVLGTKTTPPRDRDVLGTKTTPPRDRDVLGTKTTPPSDRDVLGTKTTTPSDRDVLGTKTTPPCGRDVLGTKTTPPSDRDVLGTKTTPPRDRDVLGTKTTPPCGRDVLGTKTTPPSDRDVLGTKTTPPCGRDVLGTKTTPPCDRDVLGTKTTPPCGRDVLGTKTTPPSDRDVLGTKTTPPCGRDVLGTKTTPPCDRDVLGTKTTPPCGRDVLDAEAVLRVMNEDFMIHTSMERYINGEIVPPEQPVLLTGGVLRDYQVEGFQWLQLLYENGVNGILADEMGLGKTIQCVASIADLVYKGVPGPFLICAPLSTLPNWVSEFHRFAPKVPVILYHGSKDERVVLRRQIFRWHEIRHGIKVQPVVITSYEITMNDRAYLNAHLWKYVIVDEGHRIKNSRCRLVRELKLYRSTHKMLLTGTPLQNNLAELWSLLHFLLPELFDQLNSFEEFLDVAAFDDALAREAMVKEEQQKQILSMLHELLSPFILRRLKVDVSVTIPPKREVLVYAPLSRCQAMQYRSILDRSIANLIEKKVDDTPVHYGKHGRPVRQNRKQMSYNEMTDIQIDDDGLDALLNDTATKKSTEENSTIEQRSEKFCVNVQLRNMMMLLRKCCNHPYLIEYPLTSDGEYRINEALVTSSGKFMLLDRMLTKLKQNGHKVLLFSQMTSILDVVEDYCNLRKFSYYRLDGSTKMDDRRQQIEDFNGSDDTFLFLLSTRAGGLGINLAAADTVIIFDSDWNPQQDLQAQDRCHRIGQSRPVLVFRLVTENTIDEKIVERADAKRKLEKLVLHQETGSAYLRNMLVKVATTDDTHVVTGKFKCQNFQSNFKRITPEEVMELLKAETYDKVIEGCGQSNEVISDDDLEKLLDRSDLQRLWQHRLSQFSGEETSAPCESVCCDVAGRFKVVTEDKGRMGL